MLKRHENFIKEGLLADSDLSDSLTESETMEDYLKSSDDEDESPTTAAANVEPGNDPTPVIAPVVSPKVDSPDNLNANEQPVNGHNSSARESHHSDSSDPEDGVRPPKKKKMQLDREIFDKNLLKSPSSISKSSNALTKAISASNKDASKTESIIKSPSSSKSSPEIIPEVGVDVSAFTSTKQRRFSGLDLTVGDKSKNRNEEKDIKPYKSSTTSELSKMIIDNNDDECISLSSESDSEVNVPIGGEEQAKKKFPRRKKFLSEAELQEETKKARKTEKERIERLKRKNENLSQLTQSFSQSFSQDDIEPLILDVDKDGNPVKVHDTLVAKMKPHQREGIKFMYDSCYGSLSDNVRTESGCILAHSMGLGKTLQVVSLVHVLITHEQLNTKKILIVCPKVTIINWKEEFEFWLKNLPSKGLYITFNDSDKNFLERLADVEAWYNNKRPGVYLINYEAFRNFVHFKGNRSVSAKTVSPEQISMLQDRIKKCLVAPGPDLVVCDEGHAIKKLDSAINRAVSKITTRHRIILTGTPVQNNLTEYYAMVNFAKPGILGTLKEFNNVFNNPIKDGQHEDSTASMIKRMKQRSLVLYKNLSAFVQRKESSVLAKYLPSKFEYAVFVTLTAKQEVLYKYFLSQIQKEQARVMNDYTALRKIWTHPRALKNARDRAIAGKLVPMNKNDGPAEEQTDDFLDIFDGDLGVKSNWFEQFVNQNDLNSILASNKLMLLFQILELASERGEKVLIFSNFVAVLNIVEEMMQLLTDYNTNKAAAEAKHGLPYQQEFGYHYFKSTWVKNRDYIRLDGSTKPADRHRMINAFNNESNKTLRCFLISAKAGGQGINLTGANRCIILDTSWNPSSDQQNIFRIYRLGQKKPCYAYR